MSDNRPQFYGDFENIPIDTKGRLIVPAAFRNALPNGVTSIIVTQWFDGCLAAFDPDGWRRLIDQLRNMGYSQVQSRQLVRAMAGRASEVKLDRQGRALIPRKRLDSVGITDRATLTGVVDCIEIWDPDQYNEAQNDVDMEALGEILGR
jgi:MraZ protein